MRFYGTALILFLSLLINVADSYCGLEIIEPADGALLYRQETVRLVAHWRESSTLSGSDELLRYRWSSDVDGPLGESMLLSLSSLSYSRHKLTLEAVLSDTVIDKALTEVTVIARPDQFTLSARNDWEGEFSRQGSRIAFTSFRTGDPEIWITELADRVSQRITYQGGLTPTWSADGDKLVFWSDRAGGRDLWLVDLAEEDEEERMNAVQITTDAGSEWMPAFSPLENQVVYVSKRGKDLSLELIDTTEPEAQPKQVLGPGQSPMFPRWFPDGKKILFTSYRDTLPVVCRFSLEKNELVQLSSPGAEDADVSPDGAFIVMVRQGELWLQRLVDGNEQVLTNDETGAISPRFSPDGTQIIYASPRSGNYDLWILDLPAND